MCISLNLWEVTTIIQVNLALWYKGVLTNVPIQGVAVKTLKGDITNSCNYTVCMLSATKYIMVVMEFGFTFAAP